MDRFKGYLTETPSRFRLASGSLPARFRLAAAVAQVLLLLLLLCVDHEVAFAAVSSSESAPPAGNLDPPLTTSMLHSSSAAHSGGSAHAAAPAALPQPGGPAVRLLCPAAAPAPIADDAAMNDATAFEQQQDAARDRARSRWAAQAAALAAAASADANPDARGAGPSSDPTLDLAVVGSLADDLLGGDLLGALRAQTLTLGQVRRAIAAKLGTAESRLKGNSAIKALLKQKMIAMHQRVTDRSAAAAEEAMREDRADYELLYSAMTA
jgi:hypothetical protein